MLTSLSQLFIASRVRAAHRISFTAARFASSIGHQSPNLSITYTCKVCNSRQGPKQFSRKTYQEGVVLVTCNRKMNKLYDSHIPLTALSKLFLAGGSGLTAILNPARGDMVAAMGEATAIGPVLQNIKSRMESDDTGKELLRLQPRISEESIDRLRLLRLPVTSFGREYARFLDNLKASPDDRPPVKFVDDESLLYVMRRYRETHDFAHVALQMKTNMLGEPYVAFVKLILARQLFNNNLEVTVKYFEAIQLGLPMAILGSIFGGGRLLKNNRRELITKNIPWVFEQASSSRLFIAFDWENHFDLPIRELQRKLNVMPINEYFPH